MGGDRLVTPPGFADSRHVQVVTPDSIERATWVARLRDGRLVYQFQRTASGNLLRVASTILRGEDVAEVALGIYDFGRVEAKVALPFPEGAFAEILYLAGIDFEFGTGRQKRAPRSLVCGWRRFGPPRAERWIALDETGKVDLAPTINRRWPENPVRVRE